MSFKRLHGVHVPHRKHTAELAPVRVPVPASITVPTSMNIGRAATPVVKPGDHVTVGQLIAAAESPMASPIYSGVSGTVKKLGEQLLFHGALCQTITIESDGEQTVCPDLAPPEVTDFDSFIAAVRASGVVGLGGAGFPTAVKLNADPARVEFLCINGAECEPYITADTRTMLDDAPLLGEGFRLLHRFYPAARILIGIEKNKPACIDALRRETAALDYAEVCPLPSLYPQGGEKVLVYTTTGRVVPEGKLPLDVGCIVLNATTLAVLTRYIRTGFPLVEKCVTVDGSAVAEPKNIIVPIGTSLRDVLEAAGGLKCEPKKVIMGGPMMGVAVPDLEQPVVKNTGAVLAFAEADAALPEPTACIRCGRCIDACPLKLMPVELEGAYARRDADALKALKVTLCMECGCCAFVCPARRRLVESHKLAKVFLNAKLREEKEAAK